MRDGRQEVEWGGVGNVEAAPCGFLLHQPHWVEWVDGDRSGQGDVGKIRGVAECWVHLLLGDGDAAVLSALNTLRPYGADVEIVKHECINHISKRMYRGLEKVVKDAKSAVGCGLGGKGKLTQVRMKKWSQYYRNAGVKHAPDVDKTRDAIWAIYQHSVSTEDDPQHDNCDVDWCWWQQAMAAGVDPEERRREGRHDLPLPLPAAERLLPLFERLSKPDLLERCMSLGTSNANESLHSVIWRRASKAVFATRSTVEIAVAFGVVQFNCGGRVLLDASNAVITLPESSSNQLAVVAANMDRRRLKQGSRTAKEESKTARKRKSLARLSAEASHTEAEATCTVPVRGSFTTWTYPVHWTAQSALHFTPPPPPRQTCSFRHQLDFCVKHSSDAAITREDYSLTFPPLSIAYTTEWTGVPWR